MFKKGLLFNFPRHYSVKVKAIPVHASNRPINTEKLHLINQNLHRRLGPIFSERLGPDVNAIWISDPGMAEMILRSEPKYPMHIVPQCWQIFNQNFNVKRGLFFLDGPDWYQMRKKMNPIFLKESGMLRGLEFSKRITDDLIQRLVDEKEVEVDNLESILHQWSVESTLAALYGSTYFQTRCQIDLNTFIQSVHDMFDNSAILQTQSASIACQSNSIPWQNFCRSACGAFDFLHDHFSDTSKLDDGMITLISNKFDNDEEVVLRIVNDLIIAAADTTSYTTLWTMYLLAQNPQYQSGMKAKEACKESMRLFPVAPFLTRIQQDPIQVADYLIEAGQLVLISLYAMGRDEKYFPDADQFKPERWLRIHTKLAGVLHPFASLPFSFGVRSCIGKKLAEHQMEYFLCEFFKKFRLESHDDSVPEMRMKLIGLPDRKMKLKKILL